MSEIPYYFDTPVPSDFRQKGYFKNINTLKFVTWAFSRCKTREHKELFDGKELLLKPYQFIFGRLKCSEELDISESAVRNQVNMLCSAGFLKNATNSTTKRYTIYEWITTAFSQINDQVNDQVTTKSRPSNNHKLEQRTETRELKEQTTVVASVSLVGSVSSCLVSVERLTEDEKIYLSSRFNEIEMIRALAVAKESKKPIIYFKKYIEDAIEKNWQPKEQPRISLSSEAEKNKERIFLYAEKEKEKLKNIDLVIRDGIDHVLFGHIKIFYESKSFNKDVGQARKHFNLLDNFIQAKPIYEEEEKIVQFKQLSNILIENKQTF